MKGKALCVITMAAAMLTACTENDVTTNGTEVSMEAATEAPTMLSTEAPTKEPTVLSTEMPTETPTASKAEILETSKNDLEWDCFEIKEIQKFLEAIKNGNADMFGFAVAKTVEYTYSVKENGNICITSVKTVNDTGVGLCYGHF